MGVNLYERMNMNVSPDFHGHFFWSTQNRPKLVEIRVDQKRVFQCQLQKGLLELSKAVQVRLG